MIWHTEKRKISELVPHQQNPRTMSEKQVKDLTESLKKFDLVEIPAINLDNTILAGHQRLKILSLLGRENEEIDVRVPDRMLTPEEAQEYLLRSNHNIGSWDFDMLANISEDLLKEVGFASEELDRIFKGITEDNEPPATVEPISKAGEVYILGEHRLLCGSSTDEESYKKLFMGGEKAQMVFTDPPYNVDYSYDWRSDLHKGKKVAHNFFNDKKTDADYFAFIRDVFTHAYAYTTDNASFYCWYATKFHGLMVMAIEEAGWLFSQMLIWGKNHPVLSLGQSFGRTWEPCLFGWKKGKKHYFNKAVNYRDILNQDEFEANFDMWFQKRDNIQEYVHPTQKPVALAEKGIIKSSQQGDIVLECFGGSGSTMIACEQLKRKCYMIELDPIFCDVIRKRYAQFIGREEEWETITQAQ